MTVTIVGIYETDPPYPATVVHADAVRYGMHGGFIDATGGEPDTVVAADKLRLARYAQVKRDSVEEWGFMQDGLRIGMNEKSTVRTLLGAATLGDAETVTFIENGINYGNFTGVQVRAILEGMKDFMISTFTVLGTVLADIVSGTITTTAEIEAAAWPT